MADVRYEPPKQPEWTRMATGPEIVAALTAMAEAGKEHAQALALPFSESGRYRQSFRVDVGTERFAGRKRAVAYLLNDADYAAVLELRYNVLARTRDHLQAR